jgi:hypothetical protein
MLTPEILNYILGFIALMSVAFTIWGNVRKPVDDMEIKQVVANKDLDNKATILAQKEMENKAALLAQQVVLQKETYDKKFQEMGVRLDTLDTKLNDLILTSNVWHLEITKILTELSTIIKERIPSNKNII